ncbi:hypothetical protein M431DRAFT_127375 [Trichoderma harzianum CBS 226.95]|uniref:HD domain-containing protein n=1 Tax=Trichoderma harzianum CBS 226.95 TaxID=983964 RepID=A0A2T3ZVI9_TRIHA|nr:hypothetical protein M431DRAFT_127375 [Trichoderma harzianum CBS 226.95]PTB48830.1 hypothetical protein M431DRAFT_127375 [Trichoderma harzianum CBS 226.95]
MCQDEVASNGWTSVPRHAGTLFGDKLSTIEPSPLSISELGFPSSDQAVAKTIDYAKATLHPQTFNHSMRVYYFGMAITKQYFPKQAAGLNPVTWALTCLLHDIGTAEEFLTATRMSFDIYGGIKALQVLKDFGVAKDQAEAVSEAIIRHEDMGIYGEIAYLGQLIQLATTYDNTSVHPHVKNFGQLLHHTTVAQINEAHPRLKWSTFFSGTIRKEMTIKPWCHSGNLPNFDNEIEANPVMKEWEY